VPLLSHPPSHTGRRQGFRKLGDVGRLEITPVDGRSPEVRALVERHLDFAGTWTPPEHIHALGAGALADDPDVTVFCARSDGRPVAIGALRELEPRHGELKSMHTAAEARGSGVGRAMVTYLLGVARERGYGRVSLETGSSDAFAPARALYASAGFEVCGPFGSYPDDALSCFMTLRLA
jgi:putative acetyltransferase